jgi:ketosteroid isomerase-like protein
MREAKMFLSKFRAVIFAAICSLLFFNCNGQEDMNKAVNTLLETDRDFSKASQELGAAEAFYKYADESALMLSKNSEPIRGRAAIKEAMSGMEEAVLTWKPEEGFAAESGDLGYTWGRFEFKFSDAEGEEQIRVGKYVSIWKKQDDSSWKWIVDIGNTDDPK